MKDKKKSPPGPDAPPKSRKPPIREPSKKPPAKLNEDFQRGARAKQDAKRITPAGKARSK